jgi:WD40 repeat protein
MTDVSESPAPATASGGEAAEVFLSYAREDAAFADRLYNALLAAGRTAYLDTRGIPVWSPDWQAELYDAIEKADAFVLVLSRESLASPNIALELKHAVAQGKRIKPLLLAELGDADVDEAVMTPQWIDFRDLHAFDERLADLIGFLDTDIDWVRKHTRFAGLANEWQRRQRDRSLLLGRADLREAEAWLSQAEVRVLEPPPTELQLEFIEMSREQAKRRRRTLVGAIAAALVIAVALGVVALLQHRSASSNAKSARSRQLAAAATAQLGTDPGAGLRVAIRAAQTAPTAQALTALRQALTGSFETAVMQVPAGDVTDSAFSPDGLLVATRSRDGTIRTWDARTANELARISVESVDGFAFDDQGRLVTVADNVQIWEARTGKLVKTLHAGISERHFVAIDPHARLIAASGFSGDVGVWSAKTGQRLSLLRGHSDTLRSASFDAGGKLVLTASFDGTAREWDAATGRQIAKMAVGESVNSAEFNSDASRVVTGDAGGAVRIFDARTGKQLQVMKDHGSAVSSAVFSRDGKRVLSSSLDGTARLWDVASGFSDATLAGHTGTIWNAAFSPDGRLIATASADETARIWDAITGGEVAVLRGHRRGVSGATWSRDGRFVLTSGADGTARIWAVDRSDRVTVLEGDLPANGIAFGLGGRVVISAHGFHARIWRPATGELVREIVVRGRWLDGLSLSPDGQYIATNADHGDAQLWNAATGRQIADFGAAARFARTPFSGDSTRVAIVRDEIAEVRETANGRLVSAIDDSECKPGSVALDHNGDLVVGGCANHDVVVWNVDDRHVVATLHGHRDAVTSAVFSPDGRHVLTTSSDLTARVWDARSGDVKAIFRGHTNPLSGASFSPDGKRVATASFDETARIWDARSGKELAILHPGSDAVRDATFSADGAYLLTAGGDGTARVFVSPSGEPVETFRGHALALQSAVFSPNGKYVATIAGDRTARVFRCRACAPVAELLRTAKAELPRQTRARN